MGSCRALRGYCRSSSGPAERSFLHGRDSPKFGRPNTCPLTCPPHAICLLAMRNERARRRQLNWPIYFPPTRWPRPPWPKRVTPAVLAPPPRSVGTAKLRPARSSAPAPDTPCATPPSSSHTAASAQGRQRPCHLAGVVRWHCCQSGVDGKVDFGVVAGGAVLQVLLEQRPVRSLQDHPPVGPHLVHFVVPPRHREVGAVGRLSS
jgi:hypothetical protein